MQRAHIVLSVHSFLASFDPLPLVYVLCTQHLWRYEGSQLSICTNHNAGNALNLQQETDIQIFSRQSGSQATCKLLDTCKHYLYKPDTCKPLATTTLDNANDSPVSITYEWNHYNLQRRGHGASSPYKANLLSEFNNHHSAVESCLKFAISDFYLCTYEWNTNG